MESKDLIVVLAEIIQNNRRISKIMKGDVEEWSNLLPYDAEVEWLKTDGIAYLNTGIKISSSLMFDLSFYAPVPTTNNWLFGGFVSSSSGQLGVLAEMSNTQKFQWKFGQYSVNTVNVSAGNYRLYNTDAANTLNINGTSYSATANTFSTQIDFLLLGFNVNGNPSTFVAQTEFKKGKLWVDGTLVRDYIPVRKDGVGYLYDKVSGELFGNANSSGSFGYGNDL